MMRMLTRDAQKSKQMTICCFNCPVVDVGSALDDVVFLPKQACSPEEFFFKALSLIITRPESTWVRTMCELASHWKNKKPLTLAFSLACLTIRLRNEEEINSTRNETDLLAKCFLLPTFSMSILFSCFFQILN